MQRKHYQILIIFGLALLFTGIFWWSQNAYKQFPWETPIYPTQPTVTPIQNAEVYLQLEKLDYRNNNQTFEPVKFSLVNNSDKPIYFLAGCAVTVPIVYKVEDGNRILLEPPANVCMAEPRTVSVLPHENAKLGWDQKNQGQFVSPGEYQFAVAYSYESTDQFSIGPKVTALSNVFSVERVVWKSGLDDTVCSLFDNGFSSNGLHYTQETCLESLRQL